MTIPHGLLDLLGAHLSANDPSGAVFNHLPGMLNTPHPLPGMQTTANAVPQGMPGPQLTPQALPGMPPPQVASTTPTQPRKPSLWERVQGILMPDQGVPGLLGEGGLSDARDQGLWAAGLSLLGNSRGQGYGNAPGVGQALAGAVQAGQQTFQNSAQQQVEGSMAAQQMAEQARIRQVRAAIGQAFAPRSANETPQEQVQRLMGMYSAYARAGDTEMAAKLGEVLKSMGTVLEGPKPVNLEHFDSGDHTEIIDPRTGKTIRTVPKGIPPKTPAEVDAGMRFGADQKNKILDDFSRDTKDFHQVMGGWDVLQGATKDPSLATPFAVTDAYARITNPGGIVRPTTMEMIDHMGSLGQRMRKAWDHNANGALPPDILKDFQRTLFNIVKEHKNQFDQIRQKAILRGRQSGVNDVEPLLQDYQVNDPLAPAGSPAPAGQGNAANVRQFLRK
jgi:hypothetical protein